MTADRRTTAAAFFTFKEALIELEALKFGVTAMADSFPHGSITREMAQNAARGIKARIDYLYDSFVDNEQRRKP